MVVQLSILVGNVEELIALGYSHVEIWLSEDEGNSFWEITTSGAAPAVLRSQPPRTLFRVGGYAVHISVDGGPVHAISFGSVVEHWTGLQVATRINEFLPNLATVGSAGEVVLTSPTTGRSSSLDVTYSSGVELGWVAGVKAVGTDSRIPLTSGTLQYLYTDLAGRGRFRYKWRFSADGSPPISDFSPTVSGKLPPALPSSQLAVCTGRFVSVDGRPVKTRLLVGIEDSPRSQSGLLVVGSKVLELESDDSGFIEFSLVRGSTVRVAIDGTSYIREFVVPNSTVFDLLQVMGTAPDQFIVQTVPPQLVRRIL